MMGRMGGFHNIPTFVEVAVDTVGRAASNVRLQRTRTTRVLRRFSVNDVAAMLGADRTFVSSLLKHPDAPPGEVRGRERTLSVVDLAKLRAIAAARPTRASARKREALHWRRPGDPLPVIVMSAQKGGTGKSVTTAHLAQYAQLFYGMRVGVIDADPQATCSLYFVSDETQVAGHETEPFTDFMGVPAPGEKRRVDHDPSQLDAFWKATPWPGVRLMPGGAGIQEADIAMYFLARSGRGSRRVYRMLRDALHRWRDAHPPRTSPADLIGADGRFREDLWRRALGETLDLVVIDTPPSLTQAALNTVVAADMLVIPQTMRGFDLSTLQIYLSGLSDYLSLINEDDGGIDFSPSWPFILPTIVGRSSDTDLRTIGEIWGINPDIISPVFYRHSEGASNAFREYKSTYEYQPDRSRRASVAAFVENANAVGDAILTRAIPGITSRGFADAFIAREFPGGEIPLWSESLATLGTTPAAPRPEPRDRVHDAASDASTGRPTGEGTPGCVNTLPGGRS